MAGAALLAIVAIPILMGFWIRGRIPAESSNPLNRFLIRIYHPLLLKVLQQIKAAGNTIVIIEHNLDVIKTADWVIDMGPEGGAGGGTVVATGTPETVAANPDSHTGRYLADVLARAKG